MASRILTSIPAIALTIFLVACGSVHAGNNSSNGPITVNTPNGPQSLTIEMKVLTTEKRFTLIGSAHQDCTTGCNGVPAGTGFFLPDMPMDAHKFCIDTLNIGTKQPDSARASYLVLSVDPPDQFGKPSISLRSDVETFHVPEGLCFPNEFSDKPTLWMANNWDTPQVMTFVVSGTLK